MFQAIPMIFPIGISFVPPFLYPSSKHQATSCVNLNELNCHQFIMINFQGIKRYQCRWNYIWTVDCREEGKGKKGKQFENSRNLDELGVHIIHTHTYHTPICSKTNRFVCCLRLRNRHGVKVTTRQCHNNFLTWQSDAIKKFYARRWAERSF